MDIKVHNKRLDNINATLKTKKTKFGKFVDDVFDLKSDVSSLQKKLFNKSKKSGLFSYYINTWSFVPGSTNVTYAKTSYKGSKWDNIISEFNNANQLIGTINKKSSALGISISIPSLSYPNWENSAAPTKSNAGANYVNNSYFDESAQKTGRSLNQVSIKLDSVEKEVNKLKSEIRKFYLSAELIVREMDIDRLQNAINQMSVSDEDNVNELIEKVKTTKKHCKDFKEIMVEYIKIWENKKKD